MPEEESFKMLQGGTFPFLRIALRCKLAYTDRQFLPCHALSVRAVSPAALADSQPCGAPCPAEHTKDATMKKIYVFGLALTLLFSGGCANMNNMGKGAAYGTAGGAAAGALLGQAIGGNSKATLLGMAAGAVIGGLAGTGVGHMMDRQEQDMRNALAQSEAIAVQREGNVLALTFKSDFTFAVNSAQLRSGLYAELDRVAQVLAAYPQTTITVAGHTDSTGSEDYNQTLSQKRADSVKNALIQRGVAPQRITAIGYGEGQPIADNDTDFGRQQNRRVNVYINPAQQQYQGQNQYQGQGQYQYVNY